MFMPTSNPRFSITLASDDIAVLNRYASATGIPRASVVSGLIGSAIPQLERAAALIELANDAPAGVHKALVDDLANATADAMGMLDSAKGDYNQLMNQLELALPPGGRVGKPRRRRGPGDPHLLTGGSK